MTHKIIIIARLPEKVAATEKAIIDHIGIGHMMFGTTKTADALLEIEKNTDHPSILILGNILGDSISSEELIDKALAANPDLKIVMVSSMDPGPESKHHHFIATHNAWDYGGTPFITTMKRIIKNNAFAR